jgi:hypothetical protein
MGNKVPVVSLVEARRKSPLASHAPCHRQKSESKSSKTTSRQICSDDDDTDDHFGYRGLEPKIFNHQVVKHSAKEYVRREKNWRTQTESKDFSRC